MENAGRQNHSVKVIPNNCLPEIRTRSGSAACLIPAARPAGMGSSSEPAAPWTLSRLPGRRARGVCSPGLPPPSVRGERGGGTGPTRLDQREKQMGAYFLDSASSEDFLPHPQPVHLALFTNALAGTFSLTLSSLATPPSPRWSQLRGHSSQKPSLTRQAQWPYFLPPRVTVLPLNFNFVDTALSGKARTKPSWWPVFRHKAWLAVGANKRLWAHTGH